MFFAVLVYLTLSCSVSDKLLLCNSLNHLQLLCLDFTMYLAMNTK